MSSRFTLVNTLIVLLILAVIFLSGWIYISEKEKDKLQIETIKQSDRVEELENQLSNSAIYRDSLQTVLDSITLKRIRYEEILDSLRNLPTPKIDRIRTAKPTELERYFIERYR